MNRILSLTRRCVEDYDMIRPGDRIAVGVSGGKDSLLLLLALARLRTFYPVPFTVEAVTLDLGGGADYAPIAALCQREGIPLKPDPTAVREVLQLCGAVCQLCPAVFQLGFPLFQLPSAVF